MDPIAAWHTEHVYFNQLLRLLQRQLDLFHRNEQLNYELMMDIVSYLREYTDQYHHPREDVAFERLAKSCPDLKLDLARLMQEHRVIARNGVPTGLDPSHPEDIGREDVVALEPSEEVQFYRNFRTFTGPYVAHCHNLAHEDHNMMFGWTVNPTP